MKVNKLILALDCVTGLGLNNQGWIDGNGRNFFLTTASRQFLELAHHLTEGILANLSL